MKSRIFFCLSFQVMKKYVPSMIKKTTSVFSVAVLERFICHGEIDKKKADMRAKDSFLGNFAKQARTKVNSAGIVSMPNIAEGKRVENSLRPKIKIEGSAA